jgi:hypothetical protein
MMALRRQVERGSHWGVHQWSDDRPLERGSIQVVPCEGVRLVRHLKCLKVRYTEKGNDCLFQVHRVKAESDAEAVQPDGLTRSKKPRSGPRPSTETSRSG